MEEYWIKPTGNSATELEEILEVEADIIPQYVGTRTALRTWMEHVKEHGRKGLLDNAP